MILRKSEGATRRHRADKRQREILKIVAVAKSLAAHPATFRQRRILEFGCGNGFQIGYLEELGRVCATDIYSSKEILAMTSPPFCESDILRLPFADATFDIIFSNHVVEHLPDPSGAFAELKRVAAPDCLFVFSVPTSLWLLLSLPAKYLGKVATLLQGVVGNSAKQSAGTAGEGSTDTDRRLAMEDKAGAGKSGGERSVFAALLPRGHGVHEGFGECYRAFRITSWRTFFERCGFVIHATVPLLLYGPSERPVLPTMAWPARFGWCSSVLFVMGTKSAPPPKVSQPAVQG